MGKSREIARLPNAPAFSAYRNSSQTISSTTWTKLDLGAEDFDTNGNFASSRFTPTVAGYYQLSCGYGVYAVPTAIQLAVYKNGSQYRVLEQSPGSTSAVSGSILVYLNGSTDYVEFYVNLGTGESLPASANTWATGCLMRPA